LRRFVPPLLRGDSRAPELLVALSLILAALGLADLLEAVVGGFTLVVGPAIGAALGWIAHKKGARRLLALFAIGVNGLLLAATVVAIFVFGGS
jgi:hypothetical protein